MQVKEKKILQVAVDKRHIVSIGERLYAESVELLRELINNAYDADATEAHVEIGPEQIVVRDNGSGFSANQGLNASQRGMLSISTVTMPSSKENPRGQRPTPCTSPGS